MGESSGTQICVQDAGLESFSVETPGGTMKPARRRTHNWPSSQRLLPLPGSTSPGSTVARCATPTVAAKISISGTHWAPGSCPFWRATNATRTSRHYAVTGPAHRSWARARSSVRTRCAGAGALEHRAEPGLAQASPWLCLA